MTLGSWFCHCPFTSWLSLRQQSVSWRLFIFKNWIIRREVLYAWALSSSAPSNLQLHSLMRRRTSCRLHTSRIQNWKCFPRLKGRGWNWHRADCNLAECLYCPSLLSLSLPLIPTSAAFEIVYYVKWIGDSTIYVHTVRSAWWITEYWFNSIIGWVFLLVPTSWLQSKLWCLMVQSAYCFNIC